MAVSLETRVPFLDHRLVEFALSLPLQMKIRDGQGQMAAAPDALQIRAKDTDRASQDGLRRAHRFLAARAIARLGRSAARLRCAVAPRGFLDPAPIRRMWEEHQSGCATGNTTFGTC